MLSLFGLDPNSIAKSELETYDPREGGRQRDIGDKLGDRVMSALTGIDYREKVNQLTRDKYVQKLKEGFGEPRIKKAESVVGYDPLKDLGTYTDTQLERALEEREATRNARNITAESTGQDPSEYIGITDPGAIKAAGARFLRKEREDEKRETKADLAFERNRRYREDVRRYNAEKREREIAHQDSVALKRENLDLSRLQLQMDQSKYMYDLQTRRQENRQKRATGLAEAIAALGIAFAI